MSYKGIRELTYGAPEWHPLEYHPEVRTRFNTLSLTEDCKERVLVRNALKYSGSFRCGVCRTFGGQAWTESYLLANRLDPS